MPLQPRDDEHCSSEGSELDLLFRQILALSETHESRVCEKQNVCEHRNEWLPGPARDLVIEKFPHKDCRGAQWSKIYRAVADPEGLSPGAPSKAVHMNR